MRQRESLKRVAGPEPVRVATLQMTNAGHFSNRPQDIKRKRAVGFLNLPHPVWYYFDGRPSHVGYRRTRVNQLLCRIGLLTLTLLLAPLANAAQDKPKVEVRDGDRVAFIGNEFFDGDLKRGYIETELTTRFPDKNLTFRNLGYSGDTVRADARTLCSGWATFGPEDQGFDRLKNLVEHIKPTLIFVGYGMNESFEGPKGLDEFTQGLNRMLDMLATASPGSRFVLVSPIRHEDLGRPLPDPAEHNQNIQLYSGAIEKVAHERSAAYINLFEGLGDGTSDRFHVPFTLDGIHLSPYGYWRAAMVFEREMGYAPRSNEVAGTKPEAGGTSFSDNAMLPIAPPPEGSPEALINGSESLPGQGIVFRAAGLAPGNYVLQCNGKSVANETAEQWSKGISVLHGPAEEQEEQLRKIVVAKNFDFFNFWRPDNDTYIFGYRKHEQGRNAVEIPEFEPLVAAKEAEIAKLRKPAAHSYALTRDPGR